MQYDLQTNNLELKLRTPEELRAMIEGLSPIERKELSTEWLARVRASTQPDPWLHGFAAVHRESAMIVGQGAFKGPPLDGVVEIAYAVNPDQRGKGFATEIAQALVVYAFQSDAVQIVRAHTLPELNASSRLLVKCGFEHVGKILDPDDGWVWRFDKRRG
jgi:[ribosomal protein S5]-alanine N-acetyltransferase